jgi:hypothetical protein
LKPAILTLLVLGQNKIDETKLHVVGEAKKMVKWSDSIETVLTAAKDASNTVSGMGAVDGASVRETVSQSSIPHRSAPAITVTMGVSGKREVSTQGQPDTLAWKYGTDSHSRLGGR